MRKVLLTALIFITANTFAQTWVLVPDANFQSFLTAHYPAAAFMTSGSDFYVDSDNTDIQNIMVLDISGQSIASLDGLSAFTNLQLLHCDHNDLTSLPNLSSSIIELDCSFNQLTSLPVLPSGMVTLLCSANQLTALPTLPSGMLSLQCQSNQLTNIPLLPGTLTTFDCSTNHLTALPDLPFGLTNLVCNANDITGLTNLPSTLTNLNCSSNQLTSLPVLPNSLEYLICSDNQLTSLPNQLSGNLLTIECSTNQLTILPDLPSSLTMLSCSVNQLTVLPELPINLMVLFCYQNQLDSLPELPATLESLDFHLNQVTTLSVLPQALSNLGCAHNLLQELPELPESMTYLDCNSNQLTTLPELPDSLQLLDCSYNSFTELSNLPNTLTFLNCGDNQIHCFGVFPNSIEQLYIAGNQYTCLPNYISAMDTDALGYPLCDENDPVNNPNGCQSAMGLQGVVFNDVNSDCVISGAFLSYIPMIIYDANYNIVTSSSSLLNGTYYFAADTGNYILSVNTTALSSALQINCPMSNLNNATVSTSTPVAFGGNFGVNCSGFDLGVQSVVNNGLVFPGQTHELRVLAGDLTAQFQSYCAAGISGEVTIQVSGPGTVTFNGSPNVTGNTAVYSIADFGAVGANEFLASIAVNSTSNVGDQFCVTVNVTTAASGDLNALNNSYSYCYGVFSRSEYQGNLS